MLCLSSRTLVHQYVYMPPIHVFAKISSVLLIAYACLLSGCGSTQENAATSSTASTAATSSSASTSSTSSTTSSALTVVERARAQNDHHSLAVDLHREDSIDYSFKSYNEVLDNLNQEVFTDISDTALGVDGAAASADHPTPPQLNHIGRRYSNEPLAFDASLHVDSSKVAQEAANESKQRWWRQAHGDISKHPDSAPDSDPAYFDRSYQNFYRHSINYRQMRAPNTNFKPASF